MSALRVPVVPYAAEPHLHADRLEMAVVDGWRAACRVGDFSEGQKVAYIPEGSLLPQDLIIELGLHDPPRLAGPEHNRLKAMLLRGELSQGIIYGGARIAGLSFGDDAADTLGIVKWVPQVPEHMLGTALAGPKFGFDIDDIKSWPDRLVAGEPVTITEKLHGVFCCLGLRREDQDSPLEPVVSSKGLINAGLRFDIDAPDNADNLYVGIWRRHAQAVREVFDAWSGHSREPFEMYLFGEVCGPAVQDLAYDLTEPAFYLFDVRLRYLYENWETVKEVADIAGMSTVPEVWQGPWSPDLLSTHTSGPSMVGGHQREGIVARSGTERRDTGMDHPSGRGPGRIIFKSVSSQHLLREGGTEHN